MKCKQRKQTLLIVCLLCLLTVQLYLSYVKASTTQVTTIDKFNLYFSTNSKLAFQHSQSLYGVTPFTVTLTVNSGTLNGTSTTLTMTESYGILNFKNLEATTVALTSTSPNETQIKVNGELYSAPTSFMPNKEITITWEYFKPEFLLPIMFIMGMIGLVGMFAGPIYTIRKVKKGEYYEGFRGGVIVTAVSVALFIAWLW